jgi:hypothetical protein
MTFFYYGIESTTSRVSQLVPTSSEGVKKNHSRRTHNALCLCDGGFTCCGQATSLERSTTSNSSVAARVTACSKPFCATPGRRTYSCQYSPTGKQGHELQDRSFTGAARNRRPPSWHLSTGRCILRVGISEREAGVATRSAYRKDITGSRKWKDSKIIAPSTSFPEIGPYHSQFFHYSCDVMIRESLASGRFDSTCDKIPIYYR